MYFAEKIPVPHIDGEYHHIYEPAGEVYLGPDTASFTHGEYYHKWIANDFSIIKGKDSVWHAIGITHPNPPGFRSAFDYDCEDTHEAENQFFHAVFSGKLSELLQGARMEAKPTFFWASERPEECPACYAPAVFPQGDGYRMLYTPVYMKTAVSPDLYRWKTEGKLFDPIADNFWMRDPYVFYENGTYSILYNDLYHGEEALWIRKTADFVTVSQPEVLMPHMFSHGAGMESPCLFKRDGWYYLLWSIYDGKNGGYDNRSYVFASRTLEGFYDAAPVTMLRGHAPEVICEDGQWYIVSVYYPNNGLSIAKLEWDMLF